MAYDGADIARIWSANTLLAAIVAATICLGAAWKTSRLVLNGRWGRFQTVEYLLLPLPMLFLCIWFYQTMRFYVVSTEPYSIITLLMLAVLVFSFPVVLGLLGGFFLFFSSWALALQSVAFSLVGLPFAYFLGFLLGRLQLRRAETDL